MTRNQVKNLFYFISICSFSFAFGFESASIGPQYCGKGQVAWCQNFTTAIDCNAVRHCVQTVWLTQKSPSNDGSCASCESEIDKIHRKIALNDSKEFILKYLKHSCEVTFFDDLLRVSCVKSVNKYVDSHVNELRDLLKSDINPSTLCRILGFCVEEKLRKLDEDEGVVVRYKNVVLHIPTNLIDSSDTKLFLGSKKCTWGPSYWCNNLTSSKECKSTSHCIQHVWQTNTYSDDNDSVCKICKDMVQQARDQLVSNETQEELREVFEGSCKLLPIKEVRKECIKLADEFVPELTEMLVSQMNPTAICTVAGLCNSEYVDNLLKNSAENVAAAAAMASSRTSCANCSAAVTAVERYLSRVPQNVVLEKLLRLCDQLSSFSDSCAALVVANFDGVYKFLVGEIHPFPVCHLSGMCARQYHLHPSADNVDDVALSDEVNAILATAAYDDDLPCDLCKQLVKHLKDVLVTNTTENEFLEILQGVCRQTGKFQKECLDLVDDNFEKIYKFLTEELDAAEVCREVNLCPRAANTVTDENLNLIYSRPSHSALSVVAGRVVAAPSKTKSARGVECRICRSVISIIQKEIDKPEYKNDVAKLLSKVCSIAPKSDEEKCVEFIRDYADVLINILSDQTDPGVVCAMLKLCDEVPAKIDWCPICQRVMKLVKTELENPEEERKLEDLVKNVCRLMPVGEARKCDSFISNYTSLILALLAEEIDPSVVCPTLKLCPSYSTPFEGCTQCQRLMNNVIRLVGADRSPSNVVDRLNRATTSAQPDMTVTALQLKFIHREIIVDMMSAEFDAIESCTFLHYCGNASSLTSSPNVVAETNFAAESNEVADQVLYLPPPPPSQRSSSSLSRRLSKPSCEICELLVQMYEEKVASNATEKEVMDELHKFCAKIKNPEFRSSCSHFVDEYVPKIVELLKQHMKPAEVCRALKLCTGPPLTVSHMGSSECEFCEAVVGSSEGILSDPAVIQRSILKLIKLCAVFDDSKEAECMKVISYVGPQLESILLGVPSWYYCSKINMCPYGARLTYKKVCDTQSKWCSNAETALLCDKLDYCQINVWKSEKPSL